MSDVSIAVGVLASWRYPDSQSSQAAYDELKAAATAEAEASIWRFLLPGSPGYFVAWIALDPSIFAGVDYGVGEPAVLPDREAKALLGRWADIRAELAGTTAPGETVSVEAHYPNGTHVDQLGRPTAPEAA